MRPSKLLQLALIKPSLAVIYGSFAQLPQYTFDFVVIGGGAGGNAVANRLTENLAFSVLLLEAGPSPVGLINYIAPFLSVFLRQPGPFDWNYTVTSSGLNNRVLTYPRGRILGGCTSINGLGYARGSKDDYNRYARVTGDFGWEWDELQPYLRKNERWTAPTDHHNTTGQFNPKFHGFHGINSFDNRIAAAIQKLSEEFPFNEEINSGSPLGVSWEQDNIKHRVRSSSFTSYLGPEFISRPNLHVLLSTQATRVIQTSTRPIAFRSVEFASAADAPRQRVTASKEVIISTGALETPKLLMNSGIDDETYLASMGIQPVVNLPDVGANLSVHIAVSLVYNVNTTQTFDEIIRNETLRNELIALWNSTGGGGPLGSSYLSHNVLNRLPEDSPIFQTHTDPAAGPRSTHLQGTTQNGDINPPAVGNYMTTDDEIETYLRANAAPNGHVIATASMSARGENYGVVDPDLTVKGVKGLRVVDASVLVNMSFQFIMPTTDAFLRAMTTTYLFAERVSDMINADWM
ncbi:hypothetical protein B0H19DRAFT_1099601, partial [Mycena capillaripes]